MYVPGARIIRVKRHRSGSCYMRNSSTYITLQRLSFSSQSRHGHVRLYRQLYPIRPARALSSIAPCTSGGQRAWAPRGRDRVRHTTGNKPQQLTAGTPRGRFVAADQTRMHDNNVHVPGLLPDITPRSSQPNPPLPPCPGRASGLLWFFDS